MVTQRSPPAESQAFTSPQRSTQEQHEAAADWSVDLLTMHAGTLADKQEQFKTEKVDLVADMLTSLAENAKIAGPQHDAKVGQLREALQELVGVSNEVTAHVQSLRQLKNTLQPTTAPTDFDALLAAHTQELLDDGLDPEQAAVVVDFDKRIAVAGGAAAADEEEDEDDDVRIDDRGGDGDVAPNAACPVSGTGIFEIKTPVQDQMGFVYDKESVEAFIRRSADRHGKVPCPNHGTNHSISLATLKPAHHVVREQRRRQRRTERQSQNPSANDDVLDID